MDHEDDLVSLINNYMYTNEETYLLEIQTLIKGDGHHVKKDKISNVAKGRNSAEHMKESLVKSVLFELNYKHKRPPLKRVSHAPLYIDWVRPERKILMEKYDDDLGCVVEVYVTKYLDSVIELHPPKKGIIINGKLERI